MAFYRTAIGPSMLVAALSFMLAAALAHDDTKYPDWSGRWRRPPRIGVQWDETKPIGLGPANTRIPGKFEWSINDQREGSHGLDMRYTCTRPDL